MTSTRRVIAITQALMSVALTCPPLTVAAQDSTKVAGSGPGIVVDFQDADLRTVLTSIAESGSLNIAFADLPAKRVTLRLRQPVPRTEMRAVLKSLAATYDLM